MSRFLYSSFPYALTQFVLNVLFVIILSLFSEVFLKLIIFWLWAINIVLFYCVCSCIVLLLWLSNWSIWSKTKNAHTHIAHNNTQSAGSQQSLPVRESNVYKMYYIQLEKMPANKRWRYKQNSCLKVSIFNWICSGQDWKILWIYR